MSAKERLFEISGQVKNVQEWCKEYGANPNLVYSRIRRGWDLEKAMTVPSTKERDNPTKLTYQGETKTIQEWATTMGISTQTIHYRIACGWSTERVLTKSATNATHGKSQTRLYKIWNGIKTRCYNKKENNYMNYGGRGIVMCPEWLSSFEVFQEWALSHGYNETLSIDRIDVNGNYEPSNCKFSDIIEQANNKRNTNFLTYRGETKPLQEWSRLTQIHEATLRSRIFYCCWSVEKALETPVPEIVRSVEFRGKSQSFSAWAKELNVPRHRFWSWVKKGVDIEKALENYHSVKR